MRLLIPESGSLDSSGDLLNKFSSVALFERNYLEFAADNPGFERTFLILITGFWAIFLSRILLN